jgi:hypothetical protein
MNLVKSILQTYCNAHCRNRLPAKIHTEHYLIKAAKN